MESKVAKWIRAGGTAAMLCVLLLLTLVPFASAASCAGGLRAVREPVSLGAALAPAAAQALLQQAETSTPTPTHTPTSTGTPTPSVTPTLTPTPLASPRPPAQGPLQVHPGNPRYFVTADSKVTYLTGSHNWHNLQDIWPSDPPRPFDYNGYLDFMVNRNHNFMRMWHWEMPMYIYATFTDYKYSEPHPWERTGPGLTNDGKPKFDLTRLNQAYFDRLRARVIAARGRGIYVSVMLFEGHAMRQASEAWFSHPFNGDNNVNGIDGDLNGDGEGLEVFTIADPEILALQDTYVRKVVDTVNDLDNVLYEIINEAGEHTVEWQVRMVNYLRDYEATRPHQHPIGMTPPMGTIRDNALLLNGPADWISPRGSAAEPYWSDPPAADGRKVIVLDSDHTHGPNLSDPKWIVKGFIRGHNPIYMDPYDSLDEPVAADSVRTSMGYTLRFADRIDLAAMVPHDELASTAYCLANPVAEGAQYLVYLPYNSTVQVNLSATTRQLSVEWFSPETGSTAAGQPVFGGATRSLTSPFGNGALLYIWDDGAPPTPTPTPIATATPTPTATTAPPTLDGLPNVVVDPETPLPVTVDLWAYAWDDHVGADELTYALEGAPPSGAGVRLTENRWLNVEPSPAWCGWADVQIRVTDPDDLWSVGTLEVTVNAASQAVGAGDAPPVDLGCVALDCSAGPGGTVNVRLYSTDHPNTPANVQVMAGYREITSSFAGAFICDLILRYDEGALDGAAEGDIAGAARWDEGSVVWNYIGGALDTGANTIAIPGVSGFSSWLILASTPPKPVLNLGSTRAGADLQLAWPAVTEDILGNSVTPDHYVVYRRADEPYFFPGPADVIATPTTTVFADTGVLGDPAHNYYYVVTAVNGAGVESAGSPRLGAFNLRLVPAAQAGERAYNLVALPLEMPTVIDADTLAAYAGPGVYMVPRHDAATQDIQWRLPGLAGINFSVEVGDAVYLYLDDTAPDVVSLVGAVPSTGTVRFGLTAANPGGPCAYNYISVPLHRDDLVDADALAAEIGGVHLVSRHNADTQDLTWRMPGGPGENFAVYPGYPYIVCLDETAPTHWP